MLLVAVGGSLRHTALLDNFCWGNVKDRQSLGALVKASRACYDMSIAFKTPFISGKDSLNNEFEQDGKRISIPHTLLISALAVMDDAAKAVSMDFKKAGNLIYILGATYNEMGGSEYLAGMGYIGNKSPVVNFAASRKLMEDLSSATSRRLVRSCHDLSEGGLGVALSEMAFAGSLGAEVSLDAVPQGEITDRDDVLLFSESNSRFLVEVEPGNREEFEITMRGNVFAAIGSVNPSDVLEVRGLKGETVISLPLRTLKESWQKPLRW